MTCKVEGCDRRATRRAMCPMHYQRWRKSGDPGEGAPRQRSGAGIEWIERALAGNTDQCVIWPFAKTDTGYGSFCMDGQTSYVHRYVCEQAHGAPPSTEYQAGHLCGARLCANKRHLRWVDQSTNEADKILHGRSNRGERHGSAKLSSGDVLSIRRMACSGISALTISEEFGISTRYTRAIIARSAWSWLKPEHQ